MKKIPLTQGQFALVDNADYEWLMQWKWCAVKHRGKFKAARKLSGSRRVFFMHTALMKPRPGRFVDHQDCDPLNNTRLNLRRCTRFQNARNRGKSKANTSGFKGVFRNSNVRNPWSAAICVQTKLRHLGVFPIPEDAARAYDAAALKYHGEFAKLNFSPAKPK